MFNYAIIVNDNGEMKTVTEQDFVARLNIALDAFGLKPIAEQMVCGLLNDILDKRSDNSEYLRGLAERLMHVPVMYGTDQGDTDRLTAIAEDL